MSSTKQCTIEAKKMIAITDVMSEIERFIKETVKSANADGVVIGISGGIDSAVVAHLAVRALGKDKVFGLLLPTKEHKKSTDVEDATQVAIELGIQWRVVSIDLLLSIFKEICNRPFIEGVEYNFVKGKVVEGNLQARIRMCILYAAANNMNRLVIGTTNLSEMVIGYYTKYGDGGVDFESVGHVMKSTIREIAAELGISDSILNKPPSAGLWEGQTDEGELGFTYDDIDGYIRHGFDPEDLSHKKIKEMEEKTDHKHHMPPVLDVIR